MTPRKAAQIKGEKFYNTNRPCARGHLVKRYTSGGNCTECQRENSWKISKEDRAIYYRQNKEKRKHFTQRWREMNRDKVNAKVAKRRAAQSNATPLWLTNMQHKEIQNFYTKAIERNLTVDHIIPLKSKTVCGLHVPWNLQLLSKAENCSKGNRYE